MAGIASEPATSLSVETTSPLEEQLARSHRIQAWLYRSSNGVKAPHEVRIIMAASSFQLAMDHHRAIIQLIEANNPGSALALLRPLVEAYTMGLWLQHCANDQSFQQILQHKFTRTLPELQRDLDRIKYFEYSLEKDMREMRRNLDGFTHGGILHFQWRFKDSEVRPSYPAEVITDGLKLADVHGYLALQGVIALAGDQAKANELHGKVYEMFEWQPSSQAES